MRYPCLVVDHDDTVVNSTATIHYPSFVAFMEQYRPGVHYSLEEYFRQNFNPGVLPFFTQVVGLSPEELEAEHKFWQARVAKCTPEAYPGMKEILWNQKNAGGYVCVVSHSMSDAIRRDYAANGLPVPDLIFGWERPDEQRKPNPYPLEQIMQTFALRPEQLLMLDDLKPGYDMAKQCGVPFAAAGWANDIPEIEHFMRSSCELYFKTVPELAEFLQQT